MKTVKNVKEILEIKKKLTSEEQVKFQVYDEYDAYYEYDLIDDVIRVIATKSKVDNRVNDIVDILFEDDEFMDKFTYEMNDFINHVLNADKALNIWKKTDDMEA